MAESNSLKSLYQNFNLNYDDSLGPDGSLTANILLDLVLAGQLGHVADHLVIKVAYVIIT